ncbi:hypothetical protein KSZ12_08305 [Parabacteroides distasonis]|jgi:hypothetical protein|uniref:hypothetical protein n=1 Tax=Parabacteroides distasonis TaxID=823 RepID=UPI001C38F4B7|nr:hypothetical protein [Parabacteroides distasonis]MBV4225851.1 hypothetical protein [Parabacteroides distasonis]
MIFAPHRLMVKVVSDPSFDEDMNPIPPKEDWKDFGPCRCDDISAEKKMSINGVLYDFKHKVVFDKSTEAIISGTYVRCLRQDGSVKGEGVAKSPVEVNYLPYREIWLE